MFHLPQILYLFQTFPIPIPTKYFTSLTILSKYIWQSKQARCSHDKLIKHRLAGGIGYVDFQDYYMASILTQAKEWFRPSSMTEWGQIEATSSLENNLLSWLFTITLGAPVPPGISPTMVATLKTWKKVCNSKPEPPSQIRSPNSFRNTAEPNEIHIVLSLERKGYYKHV